MLRERAGIIRSIRSFFESRNYLELDTPIMSPDLIPESCLEVFETTRISPSHSEESQKLWLAPSPEIWMKKIIACHHVNVFQICKCFRNGESTGHLHNPEFTMLEYYTQNADYTDSLLLTEGLLTCLASWLTAPFERLTMAQAFGRWAGFDLFEAASKKGAMMDEARRLGLDPPAETGVEVLYDLIFIHCVEPHLKSDKPVFLLDYPAFVPCLAKNNGKTTERWELYYKGIELANCFSEETDPEKVKQFFINEAAVKEKSALIRHKVNHDYRKIFEPPGAFPRCSGVALGVDRLIMALTGRSSIESVLTFT